MGSGILEKPHGKCGSKMGSFWKDKRVLITGNTGFKGSWLSIWLHMLGADVMGYSLTPPTQPSLFEIARLEKLYTTEIGDVRDFEHLKMMISDFSPEIIIHMAAQPIVRKSYSDPRETYEINVMGTVNLFEAIRSCNSVRAVINVTTDKVYKNREWVWGYRETDTLGGFDPYSASKACSEIITSSFRDSFFNPSKYDEHHVAVATARAGNVIGGGDWGADRLVPDFVRTVLSGGKVKIRNPQAVRPWQHVLEPLNGYMMLAQKLFEEGSAYAQAWNFGPNEESCKTVEYVIDKLCSLWGNVRYEIDIRGTPMHEANYLKLDCSKSKRYLGWEPVWNIDQALEKTIEWLKAYVDGSDILKVCQSQILAYEEGIESR